MKYATPFLPSVLAAVLAATILAVRPAHAQSTVSTATKDQEIELLKSEVKQLEQRVNTLEGLGQRVKVIDRKLEVQERAQEAQGGVPGGCGRDRAGKVSSDADRQGER
jgi:hypothetical protein